jgi:hypothetical protein
MYHSSSSFSFFFKRYYRTTIRQTYIDKRVIPFAFLSSFVVESFAYHHTERTTPTYSYIHIITCIIVRLAGCVFGPYIIRTLLKEKKRRKRKTILKKVEHVALLGKRQYRNVDRFCIDISLVGALLAG